jgi:hypothetical protein
MNRSIHKINRLGYVAGPDRNMQHRFRTNSTKHARPINAKPLSGVNKLRTYPKNSPRAAARIVAVSMLADGHLCRTELDALDRMHAHALLGISHSELQVVVRDLCEDLFSTSQQSWGAACLDPGTLTALLAEIDDLELRRKVMGLCVIVVEADAHAAEGEAVVLTAMRDHWRQAWPVVAPQSMAGRAHYV